VLWKPLQPTPCRSLNPVCLSTGKFIAELIDPSQCREATQFANYAKPDQAEAKQENYKAHPA
jgi:hypothetical protein